MLSGPECLPRDGIVWRQIHVRASSGELVAPAGAEAGDAARYGLEEDRAVGFSPDGRFLTLFRIANHGRGPWSRVFLDAARGEWTIFVTSDGTRHASTDTFVQWAGDEPHTALLVQDVRAYPAVGQGDEPR
ncbi:hypothetical protein AL346_04640 [Chelatococcus sp. CO-6]|nr:hypothetical protein AL346_04640 [Chelatococcus sp. CO-6]